MHPVVLIPGLMGTMLTVANLSTSPGCKAEPSPAEVLWIDPQTWLPGNFRCWAQRMSTPFDRQCNCHPPTGARVLFGDDNGLDAITKLDRYGQFKFLEGMVQYLQARGLTPGEQLFGAPYDWREGPVEWRHRGGAFDVLKARVERASELNGGSPVVLAAISMGAPLATLFLSSHVSSEWKGRYVHRLVSISGVFEGAVSYLKMSLCGMDITGGRAPWIKPSQCAAVVRTWSSAAWMIPTDGSILLATNTSPLGSKTSPLVAKNNRLA